MLIALIRNMNQTAYRITTGICIRCRTGCSHSRMCCNRCRISFSHLVTKTRTVYQVVRIVGTSRGLTRERCAVAREYTGHIFLTFIPMIVIDCNITACLLRSRGWRKVGRSTEQLATVTTTEESMMLIGERASATLTTKVWVWAHVMSVHATQRDMIPDATQIFTRICNIKAGHVRLALGGLRESRVFIITYSSPEERFSASASSV